MVSRISTFLGAFYSTFTEICGFKPQNDEWKLMGAAAYGNKSIYYKKIKNLVKLIPNAGFELDLKFLITTCSIDLTIIIKNYCPI